MLKAASPGAREILEQWLSVRHPDLLADIRAGQAAFGPGQWIGFEGEGEDDLRALLVASRDAAARQAIAQARQALDVTKNTGRGMALGSPTNHQQEDPPHTRAQPRKTP